MTMTQNVIRGYQEYVMSTYTRTPLVLVRGKGAYVYDTEGKKYLDFFPGWAVSGIGHCHPAVVSAIRNQAKKIIHVSNNYYNELQAALAKKIIKHSFDGKVFFCNSGAEAIEGSIKLARRFGYPSRYEIITMENSFHGRTLAAITATAQPKYQEGFAPLPAGFVYAPFNDLAAVKAKITKRTVAIMLEPIQGEGGVNVATAQFLSGLRKICNERNMLLIFDEIQTGMGRTGKMFCYQNYGVTPDVMTLSKTLGGGFPIGAFIAKRKIADTLKPGMHASTFGGNPLACAASLAVFQAIEKDHLIVNAVNKGQYLYKKLLQLKKAFSFIKAIKGKSLMRGVELDIEGDKIVNKCIELKLLINCTHKKILRLMPPLTVTKKEIDKAIEILYQACS